MTSPSISPMESVNSSSTSASRTTSSTSSTHSHLARSNSDSHVFPSHRNIIKPQNPVAGTNPRGLSADTKALYRQLLQNTAPVHAGQDERTVLFSSGLQWLLDVATEAESKAPRPSKPSRPSTRISPLTEDAVRGLDRHGRHSRVTELRDGESDSSSDNRARVNAWVSETDAAP